MAVVHVGVLFMFQFFILGSDTEPDHVLDETPVLLHKHRWKFSRHVIIVSVGSEFVSEVLIVSSVSHRDSDRQLLFLCVFIDFLFFFLLLPV